MRISDWSSDVCSSDLPLRNAITTKTQRVYGHRPDTDTEITVTSGATEAIFNAIHAVVRAGDEVIMLDPAYDCYEPAIDLAGARAVHVPLDPANFAPDWPRVTDAIDRKSVVSGTSVYVRVDLGGRRTIKIKKIKTHN